MIPMNRLIRFPLVLAGLLVLLSGAARAEEDAAPVPAPVALYSTRDGGLSYDGGSLSIAYFMPGWGGVRVRPSADPDGTAAAWDVLDGAAKRTLFRGRAEWTALPDGTVQGDVSLECVSACAMQTVALAAESPAVPSVGEGDGTTAECVIHLGAGRSLRLALPASAAFHCQDNSPWGGAWAVRLGGFLTLRDYRQGERVEWHVTLSAPGGLALSRAEPFDIHEGAAWTRLNYRKDIEPGSALDFSALGLVDAPAGKHGALRSVGDHFEFDGLPGVTQRFHGVNLCYSACFLDHETADRLVERLVRSGYNSIRIHHHDGTWAEAMSGRGRLAREDSAGEPPAPPEPPAPLDDAVDRLDYLAARAIERGLYLTTDLYVSRRVPWIDLGEDRDGAVGMELFKTLVGVDEAAFRNWCDYTRAFLEHVNPYTGRAWKDELGMPLISLVNEGRLSTGWPAKAADSRVRAAWRAFCAETAPGESVPDVPPAPGGPRFTAFDEWVARRTFERCAGFVRSLGCRALLTNDNNGARHGPGEGATPLYDYVDNHFYVDHPQFSDRQWALPSHFDGANPVLAGKPAMLRRRWARRATKPYAASEWNFCGPSRYRAAGGLLAGALALEDGWDGLWRFAYSHGAERIADNPAFAPGYFDAAIDPITAASDRAVACLFLRGDAQDAVLRFDREVGSAAIDAPLTYGGFAERGRIDAGPLSFELVGGAESAPVPAVLWVSSLDGASVAESSRLLLTFLTDVQGDGVRTTDATRKEILAWGRGCLVENGAADVALRLADPDACEVWRLDTTGRRIARVPAATRNGSLGFHVATRDADGSAALFWEISRTPPHPARDIDTATQGTHNPQANTTEPHAP